MKKILLSLVVLTALVAFGATQVEAANTIGVTVTMQQTLSVSVDKPTWAIGTVAASTSTVTTQNTGEPGPPGTITATNTGNGPENLTITVGAVTGGWTFANLADVNKFAMNLDKNGTPFVYDIPVTVATGASLVGNLAAGAIQPFDLQLVLPTSTTVGGTQQSFNVTVIASP